MTAPPDSPSEAWLELPNGKLHWLQGRCAIGRQEDNDLALEARALSRHHATLLPGPRGYAVTDLGSSNGTFVNNKPARGPVALRDGDEIRMGELMLRYRCTRASDGPASDVSDRTTQMPARVRTQECRLLVAELEGFAALREKSGAETARRRLQEWIHEVRPLIETNGGAIKAYFGETILAYWPVDLTVPEQTIAALRGLEQSLRRSELPFRALLHHGSATVSQTESGEELGGRDVTFVLQACRAAGKLRVRMLLTSAAVRALELEGQCEAAGTANVEGAAGLSAFFTLPQHAAAAPGLGRIRRVLLVEESTVLSDGFVRLLESERDIAVCDRTQLGVMARRLHAKHQPDLVIIDLSVRTTETLALIGDLLRADPQTRVLVFTTWNDPGYIVRALRAGALGYMLKSDPTEQVIEAVRVVSEGGTFLSRQIAGAALRQLGGPAAGAGQGGPAGLSDRELDVFRLIGLGQPNRDIALALGISVKTVETHRENIKVKLGLSNAAELSTQARNWATGASDRRA